MNNAKILSSIKEIPTYLDLVGISFDSTIKKNSLQISKYSEEYFQANHQGDYENLFSIALKNRDYDYVLFDGSFFQFTASSSKDIHYAFFHRIEETMGYDEFLEKYLNEDNIDTINAEYEMYLSTDKKNQYPCPIRYDVAEREYRAGTHAYAHLHFGIKTDIRIPVDKIIKPLEFVDFVVKHIYKKEWETAYNTEKFKSLVNSLKKQSHTIDFKCFTEEEKLQLYIT